MYHVSAQGVDERMINVHYYYYRCRAVEQKEDTGEIETLIRGHCRRAMEQKEDTGETGAQICGHSRRR